jgi:sugar lactone lactonase YvrE
MKMLLSVLCAMLWASNALGQGYDIYVSDAGNFSQPPWQILKFDENGENPEVFITENLAWPQDIVFVENTNTVLVSNFNSGKIERYNATTGAFIDTFASGIAAPTRMKIGPEGRLYVLQWSGNGRVLRYDRFGELVDNFTNLGLDQGIGLDWDSAGNLYVASYNRRLVRKFDINGLDQGNFISNNLAGPTNIWFDDNGDLLVSDFDGGAVKRFDSQGVYLGNFINGLSQSEGVDFLPNGNVLIGNGGTHSVKMFTPGGTYVEDIIPNGSGGLIQPNAVVVREKPVDFQINAGLNDAWFDPATNGQGFLVTVFPDIQQMFVAWFTYDTERPPEDVTAILGDPGHRWLTAQGPYDGDSAEMTIFLTSGGVFDSAQPPATTDLDGDGTLTIKFAGCNEATVSYEITSLGISGVIPIQRIVEDNVALCEALAKP